MDQTNSNYQKSKFIWQDPIKKVKIMNIILLLKFCYFNLFRQSFYSNTKLSELDNNNIQSGDLNPKLSKECFNILKKITNKLYDIKLTHFDRTNIKNNFGVTLEMNMAEQIRLDLEELMNSLRKIISYLSRRADFNIND